MHAKDSRCNAVLDRILSSPQEVRQLEEPQAIAVEAMGGAMGMDEAFQVLLLYRKARLLVLGPHELPLSIKGKPILDVSVSKRLTPLLHICLPETQMGIAALVHRLVWI